jgi:putative salt-induced outer membrane protein
MKNEFKLGTIAAMAVVLATSGAFAQELMGTTALNDTLDDIDRDVAKDMARSSDASRFGNPESRPGLSGSASLSYSGESGNSDNQDLTIGTRLRYASGQFVQTLGLAIDFQEAAGNATSEDIFMVYDANYYINDKFYVFALARVQTDGLAGELVDGTLNTNYKKDAFLGFGPGYRVVNTDQMTWRVQAGVGKSYTNDYLDNSTSEVAGIVSSRFFYGINENLFVTNDTDILNSKSALRINNELGLNVKMTDAFSTRISYLSEYNDSRAIKTDNKLGVSLVYGF